MYNVRLNKTALQSGRDFVQTSVLSQVQNHSFPLGTTELLKTLLAQAEGEWAPYRGYFMQKHQHSIIFGMGVKAITLATVAAELVSEFHWVLRVEYAPQDGETLTDSQRQFAHDARRLLNLMAGMIETLKLTEASNRPMADLRAERYQRLDYARHLADLGVKICKPANYRWQHPETSSWLSIRARVLRMVANALTEQAKADESLAQTASGRSEQ